MMCYLATIKCMQKFMGIFQGSGIREYVITYRPASPITTQWTQTYLKRLQDVLKRSRHLTTKSDVVKKSGKRRLIKDVLKIFYLRCLEDVWFTTSWRRLIYNVLKTSVKRRLEDVSCTTSWRRPIYVVLRKSNLWRLQDVWFTTSWGRLIYNGLKTSN